MLYKIFPREQIHKPASSYELRRTGRFLFFVFFWLFCFLGFFFSFLHHLKIKDFDVNEEIVDGLIGPRSPGQIVLSLRFETIADFPHGPEVALPTRFL